MLKHFDYFAQKIRPILVEHARHQARSRPTADYPEIARRFLVIVAVGFWLGGFTFYAGVVIHTGHRVFGSARETGFLTQQVTGWLNASGVAALAILFWNALASRNLRSRWLKSGLWWTWVAMAAVQVMLYALHPLLDRMLNVETHRIVEQARFYHLHAVYMNLSTFQWSAGLLHTLLALLVWRARDRDSHSICTGISVGVERKAEEEGS